MVKEKLVDLSTKELRIRKKFALILVGVFICVFALNVTEMVAKFLDIGKLENISTLVPGFVCIMMAIPMYMGIKKIDEELKNR